MNKIFKVIWNHTAQRFVVTSELTKSNGKSSSTDNRIEPTKTLVALSVASAALLGSTNAMAAAAANTPISISGNDIYIASDADGNTAFGKNAYANNPANTDATLSLAIGANAKASGNATTAIGRGSVATGDWSMAIGSGAAATGSNDVAIGEGAKSSAIYAVAIGKGANASSETAVSIGYLSEAKNGVGTVAVGRSAISDGNQAVAIGMQARATGANSTSIGQLAATNAADAIAIGTSAGILPGVGASSGDSSIAIGRSSLASGTRAVALGRSTWARGLRSTAMGQSANTEADYSIAIGNNANVTVATATNSIAMGNLSTVSGSNSISIGPDSNVTGNSSIAIGVGNVVSGDGAGAFGDPSIVAGAGSYTQGNDNAVGSQSSNVGAFGNNNQIGATATYANGKLQTASGLANEVAVENSRVVGNNNYITSSNTYVLGSSVGVKDDGSLFTSKTVENSVYLGNDSTIAKGATVGTKNLTKEDVAGTTTTAGDEGTVKTANVSSIIYGGFAGDTAKGAVTVGSAGEERRIMNVAAGEISKTSTDAINGSQLYLVASHITDNAPFQYVDKDGNPVVKIGDKYYPAGTTTDANGNIVDKDGNAVQPVADQDSVVIKAKGTNPENITNVKGNLDNTYSGKKDIDGNEIKPTTEASLPEKFDPTSSNFNKGVLNNAATVGDVLNAGWNLQGNGSAVDFVKPYDTVNFINGKPKNDAKPVDTSDTQVNVINPSAPNNTKGDATQLGNVAAGTETLSNPVDKDGNQLVKDKDNKYYPAGTELNEDGSVKSADAKPVATQPTENVSNAYNGLADLNGSNATNVLTVADAKKLGWVVSASGNDYADDVRNANRVDFVGKDGIKVTGETTAAGVREITISLEKGEVAKSNEKTITVGGEKKDVVEVTDDEGNKTYYEKDNIDPTTGKPTDTTKALTPDTNTEVENKGNGFVDGNQVADAIQKSGFYVSKETDVSAVDFNNKEEKINPDDKLKFADGTGTTVNLGTVKQLDDKGEVSTTTVVKVDIDQGTMEVEDGKLVDKATETAKDALTQAEKALTDLKADPNTTAEDLVEAAQKVIDAQKLLDDLKTKGEDVVKAEADLKTAQEALKTLKADEQTTPEQLIKAANDALAAEKALEKAQNKVATVQNVVDTINKSGFNLKTSATAEGEKVSGSDELINPGDAVEMVAGKNLTVKQEADGKVTFATKDKVAFTEVKVGDTVLNEGGLTIKNGPSITASGIDAGDKKITHVADGEISPTSKDAVNGSQLYNVAQNINNRLGDVNKRIDDVDRAGRRGAAIAGAIGMIPQPHMSGRSMVGAATTSYRGEQALAVGYSRISDNSKHIIKFSGSSNMSGKKDMMVGAAYGYQW
ncbi:ESPR-type extended signal peptide-containing protein [uncultured Actinobacillus sp.]|uniref:ESPR-type extended signal peptide-containing protein n=1 Tax=uncultured Actinobacillus sp. TaxID=417616 RepID=UPI0025EC45F2|nr:ESPR-type extended signal peptide-containing protein [uncultured Actinobacillus sp.]